jgi:hypothetical protein
MSKKDDWTKVHANGFTTFERIAHGCRLRVAPVEWRHPNGEASWTVSCDSLGSSERGRAQTMRGAKVAAMRAAAKLGRMVKSSAKKKTRSKVGERKPKANAARSSGAKKARASTKGARKPPAAKRPKTKATSSPRTGVRASRRQHVESLRQRTADLLAGMPPLPTAPPPAPASKAELEAEIARVSAEG